MTQRALVALVLALAWLGSTTLAVEDGSADDVPEATEAPVTDEEFDEIELVPSDAPSWSVTNMLAPVTGIFYGGWGYWYSPRVIEVETTPPGAALDLFYVRRNFQKAYEQADAPARVTLPPRIEATPRDSMTIRALLDGYKQKEIHLKVRSRITQVMIDLAPLPNSLVAFSHTYFAGRGTLTFLTKEQLAFRLQRGADGLGIVLTETSNTPAASATMDGVASALVEGLAPQQLGEDLVIRVKLTELGRAESIQTRSRQAVDPVRNLHLFALDLVPDDDGAAAIESARAALARIGSSDASGCALAYDSKLRESLEPADLARALTQKGAYTDKFLRAAMKRLGEVSPGGVIVMVDGSTFRGAVPIELMAAATQPGEAVGYLSVLRRFVAMLEVEPYQRATLRGLIAPELAPARFETIADAAEGAERSCASSPSQSAIGPTNEAVEG